MYYINNLNEIKKSMTVVENDYSNDIINDNNLDSLRNDLIWFGKENSLNFSSIIDEIEIYLEYKNEIDLGYILNEIDYILEYEL